MRFTIDGEPFEIDRHAAAARIREIVPEPVQTHWVDVDGVRFPIKQALEAAFGLRRSRFTSHTARSALGRLGFTTGTSAGVSSTRTIPGGAPTKVPLRSTRGQPTAPVSAEQAGVAFSALVTFLRSGPLTTGVSTLEYRLLGAGRDSAAAVTATAGLTEDLLQAALIVRRDVGRVSDVIHAAVISLALPVILEEGETVVNRPSLGPGNDPSRPYDLETDRRIAEFKVALWSGGDMMRRRTLTADLVHLALDESGRRPELWVAGDEPIRFLRTSAMTVDKLLSRSSQRLRDRYHERYGSGAIPMRSFTTDQAGHVCLRNLADVLPVVASALL
ncbi:hypothetical protein JIG36_47440 [Actinoplanes sp. LDG1-06]|uniref:Uncharacterized protein n=1 Tax=Paractinoplanes ovalisporus TaxID=2810368 RepID=A0ABS2ATH6_9ACTN|nr:hypothetical protein [Actinoplanes ovalisporus]MBM2623157.1 hypothetical protein [Actinoplanes ovalisporus]